LYRTARVANTISAVASGDPGRMSRRAGNVILGRSLGRAGFWRSLWRWGAKGRRRLGCRSRHRVVQPSLGSAWWRACVGRSGL